MKRNLYLNLALTNIKKNLNIYVPYILSASLMLALIYDMSALAAYNGAGIRGWTTVSGIFNFGAYISAFFALIFIYNTGNYLLRQKKKQIGLYTILGMNKQNVNKVQLIEIFIAHIISLIFGLAIGMALIKILFAIFLNMMHLKLVSIGIFKLQAVLFICVIALISFVLTLINSVFRVSIANPIDLLKSEQKSEKKSRFQWFFTIAGIVCLGIGYYMAQSVNNPLSALNSFFLAVCFVISGTFYFMSATLIFLFDQLKKNKRIYYKSRNFIAISSIVHRVRQNASGLASICVLSTAVLVTLSTTFAVYYGTTDSFSRHNLQDYAITISAKDLSVQNDINSTLDELATWVNHEFTAKNMRQFTSYSGFFKVTDSGFESLPDNMDYSQFDFETMTGVMFMSLEDYNQTLGTNYTLKNTDVLLSEKGFDRHLDLNKINVLGQNYSMKIIENKKLKTEASMQGIFNSFAVIVADDALMTKSIKNKMRDAEMCLDFNIDGNEDEVYSKLQHKVDELFGEKYEFSIYSRYAFKDSFLELNAGLLFLGIIVGLIFMIATALIIYYKQISEAYQDVKRYDILDKVGMTETEIKKTINLQVLMLFYIPIVFALVHFAFAFKMLNGLVKVVGLFNMWYLVISCVVVSLVFIIFYFVFYRLSSKVYYNIVSTR